MSEWCLFCFASSPAWLVLRLFLCLKLPARSSEYSDPTHGFLRKFRDAVTLYVDGKWPQCKAALHEGMKLKPKDGPCLHLLNVMKGVCALH